MEEKVDVKIKPINRDQIYMQMVDLEASIPADHPVRAIWEFVEELDLSALYKKIQSKIGEVGCSAHDPKMLMALWLYAYSDGINSAREVESLSGNSFEGKKAYQWLCGGKPVNHHTLSDFRIKYKEELDELFTQILGVLSHEGLITLKRITQDGTKIRANAGSNTFRREKSLKKHLKLAKKQVELLSDPNGEPTSIRKKKAQLKGAKEKSVRLKKAMEEYEDLEKEKKRNKKETRVSTTDPESRIMKQSNGGYNPSYNVQIAVDTENAIVVGKDITNDASDYNELEPMLEQIKARTDKVPNQIIVDGGYNSYSNIVHTTKKGIDLIAGEKKDNKVGERQYKNRGVIKGFYAEDFKYDEQKDVMMCPAGKELSLNSTEKSVGVTNFHYRAKTKDCQNCEYKSSCCPKLDGRGRSVIRKEYDESVIEFEEKMKTKEAKKIYKQRGRYSEFVNIWIKEKFKLRQFRLRGFCKVNAEITIAVLAYNIMQWYRLIWLLQREA